MYRVGQLVSLETHLRLTHKITNNEVFALCILFLNKAEIEEQQVLLEPRLNKVRAEIIENPPLESKPDIAKLREERELREIQRNLIEQLAK